MLDVREKCEGTHPNVDLMCVAIEDFIRNSCSIFVVIWMRPAFLLSAGVVSLALEVSA